MGTMTAWLIGGRRRLLCRSLRNLTWKRSLFKISRIPKRTICHLSPTRRRFPLAHHKVSLKMITWAPELPMAQPKCQTYILLIRECNKIMRMAWLLKRLGRIRSWVLQAATSSFRSASGTNHYLTCYKRQLKWSSTRCSCTSCRRIGRSGSKMPWRMTSHCHSGEAPL